MWSLLVLPISLIVYDYLKAPIDRLYFTNPRRPVVAMRNTLIDLMTWTSRYSVNDHPGLWLIKTYFEKIRTEFIDVSKIANKQLFHELDVWFEKNDDYYFYRVEEFPFLKNLIDRIPCIHKETALFAVMDGPMSIPPHRAETNLLLRYHITIQGGGDCTLYTERGPHEHREGEDFLFDHARYHEVTKTGNGRRVVLILDVHRCF